MILIKKKKKKDISSNVGEWKMFIVQCVLQKHALSCPAYDEILQAEVSLFFLQ